MTIVRRPTTKTYLALCAYLALLGYIYRAGDYWWSQEADLWSATPFMIVPVVVPIFVRRLSRGFWALFGTLFGYCLITNPEYGSARNFGTALILYFVKCWPSDYDFVSFSNYFIYTLIVYVLFSSSYGLISIVASTTYYRVPEPNLGASEGHNPTGDPAAGDSPERSACRECSSPC